MTPTVHLLDYGAGNVRSVRNAISHLGYQIIDIESAKDIENAEILIFPGVGHFRQAMTFLNSNGYGEALKLHIQKNKKYFGICLGMQTLFQGSEEFSELKGLGIVPGLVQQFDRDQVVVPHMGWSQLNAKLTSNVFENIRGSDQVYFVHSYRAVPSDANQEWVLSTTDYGGVPFISAIQRGNVVATQFHPEKSGQVGLNILKAFLEAKDLSGVLNKQVGTSNGYELSKRVIACLDVRSNDNGDLVVTKGDQYDVREESDSTEKGSVRNLGKPVDLCQRYYTEGADEISFLNICSFREDIGRDNPMMLVLQAASEKVFVPLTVGGGIRAYTDASGEYWSAADVAAQYFRSGADKVSIGSDAVYAAEKYWLNQQQVDEASSVALISKIYGSQAVVVSIDARRVYLDEPNIKMPYTIFELDTAGPKGEKHCWYQATVRGGREGRDIDVIQLAKAVEALGAGEILLNSVDMDGQKNGYDTILIAAVKDCVRIPVIASSGAGKVEHFTQVIRATKCDAVLAAGIFHRKEVAISDVKQELNNSKIPCRV